MIIGSAPALRTEAAAPAEVHEQVRPGHDEDIRLASPQSLDSRRGSGCAQANAPRGAYQVGHRIERLLLFAIDEARQRGRHHVRDPRACRRRHHGDEFVLKVPGETVPDAGLYVSSSVMSVRMRLRS